MTYHLRLLLCASILQPPLCCSRIPVLPPPAAPALSSGSVSSTTHSTGYCLFDSSLNQHNKNPPGMPKQHYINASPMLQEHLSKCLENRFRWPQLCSLCTLARKWLKRMGKTTANNVKDCIPIMFAALNPIFAYLNLCAILLCWIIRNALASCRWKSPEPDPARSSSTASPATSLRCPATHSFLQTSACLGRSFYRNCFNCILSHASVQPKKFKRCSWHSLFQYRWSS